MSATGAFVRRWRINRHMARAGAYIRFPVEGEVLEALDQGRLVIGEGTLLEPGCWLTLSPQARIEIGEGCFLNRNVMLAALERIEIGDHVMFANGCFVGDAAHRFDDPDRADHRPGVHLQGARPNRIQLLVRGQLRGDQRRRDRRTLRDRRQLRRHPRPAAASDRRRDPGEGDQADRVPAHGVGRGSRLRLALAVAIVCAAFAGCGGDGDDTTGPNTTSTPTRASTTTSTTNGK